MRWLLAGSAVLLLVVGVIFGPHQRHTVTGFTEDFLWNDNDDEDY